MNAITSGATAIESFYEGKTEHVLKAIPDINPYSPVGVVKEVAAVSLFSVEAATTS